MDIKSDRSFNYRLLKILIRHLNNLKLVLVSNVAHFNPFMAQPQTLQDGSTRLGSVLT